MRTEKASASLSELVRRETHRYPDLRPQHLGAVWNSKLAWRDTNDGERLTVETNGLADERLVAAAKSAGIPYTVQGSARATWTDADAMIRSGRGPATGVISIPTRYMHSPNETIAVKDLDACARLLAEFIRQIDAETDFRP